MKDENQIVPVYSFAPDQEGVEPMKRKILKTMEVTETFTAYEVLQYIAKMDKAIEDKEAEIQGLKNMREAYIKEMAVVEEQTSVNSLQEDYQKEETLKAQHNNENTSMDKQETQPVESPYTDEIKENGSEETNV